MNKYTKRSALAMPLLGLLVLALPVQAASFDCAKAQIKVEHMVCDNSEISRLDDDMNKAYRQSQVQRKNKLNLAKQQKKWLKERNVCSDVDCLEMTYRSRIDELTPDQSQERFIPILSKDKSLCEAYKRYVLWEINETQNNDRTQYRRTTSLGNFGSLTWYDNPPQCKRPFGEKVPEFNSVKWREIKPADYPELSGQAERYLNYWPWNRPEVAHALTEAGFKEGAKGMISQHSIDWLRMWLGEADIGNNGQVETLLKIDDGRCAYDPHWIGGATPARWRVPVMVVDTTGKKIDTVKTEWILGVSIIPKVLKPLYAGMHSLELQSFDVFGFSGHTYYDRWEDEGVDWGEAWTPDKNRQTQGELNLPNHAVLTVYMISQEKTAAVCRFKFKK